MKIATLFFLLGFTTITLASDLQWAAEVIKVSSESEDDFYNAEQVLGPPNAVGGYEDAPFSWSPKKAANQKEEFIEVAFDNPIYTQQIIVVESLNPGAIASIVLYDEKGNEYQVYQKKSFRPAYRIVRMFTYRIERTTYKVAKAKIILQTDKIKGYNQLDAIGIADTDKKIKLHIDELDYAEFVEAPENLGKTINSKYSERLPIISPDGSELYFTRKNHPDNTATEANDDIWYSEAIDDDNWSKATNPRLPLNNDAHNYVVAISADNQLLYLANAYQKRVKDGVAVAKRKGDNWSKPEPLKIKNMYNKSPYSGYHVSADGNILLMAIERNDTKGDRDLYVSFKKGDEWTEPLSLGDIVNTVSMESSVFLAADNRTLYFSSNGFLGYGGLDIYRCVRLDDTWQNWSTPKNLGKFINTAGNDYGLTIPASGDFAYLASDYMSYGESDLFRIWLPQEARPQPITIVEEEMAQDVELDGTEGEAVGYVDTNKKDNEPLLVPIKKGGIIPINNLYFEANKATLKTHSYSSLDRVVAFLKYHNELIVEIGGHTNGWCSDEYADELSADRAKVVVDYLTKNGIASHRLKFKGYGKAKPIMSNETPDGRRRNQRVEITILDILKKEAPQK